MTGIKQFHNKGLSKVYENLLCALITIGLLAIALYCLNKYESKVVQESVDTKLYIIPQ